ncbi:TIGR00725 family protein [Egicoccus sp. AB-alg2]|uniref:SLOG cluster 4 domain-containing protein n=1 Tax=Egicoccus sp. AB-alg2 TaxID=3242693 RepID=UPI00359D29D8
MAAYVAIIVPGDGATEDDRADAREAGRRLAEAGHTIVTGGLGGVMEAAAEGAATVGGISVGLLPGMDRHDGAAAHTVLVPTGMGELRNGLVIRTADAVLCIGGSWGSLSEVALAVRTGRPVVALRGWPLPGDSVRTVPNVEAAVQAVLERLSSSGR